MHFPIRPFFLVWFSGPTDTCPDIFGYILTSSSASDLNTYKCVYLITLIPVTCYYSTTTLAPTSGCSGTLTSVCSNSKRSSVERALSKPVDQIRKRQWSRAKANAVVAWDWE
ncbi:hypothetical protein [Phaffia rhodozyma]|uniref:Uncharacterized protein n=1 Tax=Phaffia rhodozyma TaxID=264483 RepID=A0A0F7STY2_PHARH|nr:hypothetical protein [Phaffia rhodozyma]